MMARQKILEWIREAQRAGARKAVVCEFLGLSLRTVQRWSRGEVRDDGRRSNRFAVKNALAKKEQKQVVDTCCSPRFRDLSPNQIVPILAEEDVYLASESTFYRVLKAEGLQKHRSKAKAPKRERPEEITATGPNQVWTWDISYLLTTSRGVYFYLYLFLDIWDRSIVGWAIHDVESGEHAADLLRETCLRQGVHHGDLTVHQDNGAPMTSAEFLAMLSKWGRPSFSRPGVCDDNAFSESLFRTLKYRPAYPDRFESITDAREWMHAFADWYNNEHRHSAIKFVAPLERREGKDVAILKKRDATYKAAYQAHPERWSGKTRNWNRSGTVTLNKRNRKNTRQKEAA